MEIISLQEIMEMEQRFRTQFINSLPGVRGANLIGTISEDGITNLAIFNSVVHIGAHPPYMGLIMRPVHVPRGTYQNILATGVFTINHVHEGILAQSHQTSARYEISEFDATGLTPKYTNTHKAPYVAESKVSIGLRLVEDQLIRCNETRLLIGEVTEVILQEEYRSSSGTLQLEQAGSMGSGGLETYYSVKTAATIPYAKVPTSS